MKYPILSICIPTYNREIYLDECLKSITDQFKDLSVKTNVEIVILDNNSSDETTKLVNKYIKSHSNIKYFKNKRNIGARKNVIKVASYARGEFVWFFSDDDIQKKDSIKTVLDIIKRVNPEFIICNVDMISKTKREVIETNCLSLSKNISYNSRKEFFSYLNTKFFYQIDWYTTFYSNYIIRREIIEENKYLISKYNSNLNLFPHTMLYLYSTIDYKMYLISKSLLFFRSNNRSFGSQDLLKFLKFWDEVLDQHYKLICSINKKYIPISFVIKVKIKNLLRSIRIISLKYAIH